MKKSIKERFDAFIDELGKDFPTGKSEGLDEAFVLVGVRPCDNGTMDYYGCSRGNKMSICAALTSLFNNDEMIELLDIASGFAIEQMKKEQQESEKEE